jgi:hypothetical protein
VGEAIAQLVHVGGEVLVDVGLVREIHYEALVIRVRGMHQIQGRRIDRLAFGAHGARVVDQNAERDGYVLVLK